MKAFTTTHHCRTACSNGRGFTLIELLLVLVIVLVSGGFALTSVQRFYEKKQIQDAAETVRRELAAGRLYAIDTGVIYRFEFENEGRQYVLQPLVSADDASNQFPVRRGQLPETVRFEMSAEGPAIDIVNSSSTAGATPGTESADWVTLALFSPDGTASDAIVHVVDAADRSQSVFVRGLTGTAAVGALREGSRP